MPRSSPAPAPAPARASALRGAALSLLCLPTGLLLAFAVMKGLDLVAPSLQERVGPPLFFAVVGGCAAAAGAAWGALLARPLGGSRLLAGVGGAVGYGLAAPAAVWGLTFAETALQLQAQNGAELPPHLVFGAIFPAATALVVLAATLSLALGLGRGARAVPLALRCALAAGLAFALVDLAMHVAGWRIGAPNAEARFTMLVVMALGLLAATLVGGATLGRALGRTAG